MLDKIKIVLTKMGGGKKIKDKLIKQGAKIGENVSINTRSIDMGHAFLLEIGNNVILAAECMILMHDASTKNITGYSKVAKVVIGDNVFVGARSIILPGCVIGSNVIIGAGTMVTHSIESNTVVAGNPCRVIGNYDDFVKKNMSLFENGIAYETYWPHKTPIEKQKMIEEIEPEQYAFDP